MRFFRLEPALFIRLYKAFDLHQTWISWYASLLICWWLGSEVMQTKPCTKIADKTLKQISKSCPRLIFLSIAGCHRITDAGFTSLVKGCYKLQNLDASFRGSQSCAQITSDTMNVIASSCVNLTYLDVISCSNISEASVVSVVSSCRYLKQLNVRHVNFQKSWTHSCCCVSVNAFQSIVLVAAVRRWSETPGEEN